MENIEKLFDRAFLAFHEDRFDDAEALYHRILALDDPLAAGSAIYMLGFVKAHKGDYTGALEIYTDLYASADAEADHDYCAVLLHQIGMVHRLAGDYPAALGVFDTEFSLRTTHLADDMMGFSANLYEQGYIAFLSGDSGRGRDLLARALDYGEQADDPMCRGCALRGLGEIEAAAGNRADALAHFLASAELFRSVDEEKGALEVEEKAARLQ